MPREAVPDGPELLAPHVSRETLAVLERYAQTLVLWQRKINLIGPNTVPELWRRHLLDSVQLWPDLVGVTRVVDLGSGAGLPGLVLAACGVPDLHLVEADQRKAVFLRDAARVMGVPATVHAARAEALAPLGATAATARALAPLDDLLDYAARHLVHGGKLIALKGERWADEVRAAERRWRFAVSHRPSLVDPAGAVVILEAPRRV